ncbi:MAG: hypothetical protein AAFV93_16315 [Chloroflexota bacterium]
MRNPRRNRHRRFNHRPKPSIAPQRRNEQAIILSGLNVLQVLDDHAPKYLHNVLHYGPNTFTGVRHASAVVWYRRKGYAHYRHLNLFGVWATQTDDITHLIIGKKQLDYTASVYTAESYHSIMKETFIPYYGKDVSPPTDANVLYQTAFDITHRLALRKELAEQLAHWFKNTLFT